MIDVSITYRTELGRLKRQSRSIPQSFAEMTKQDWLCFLGLLGRINDSHQFILSFIRRRFFSLPVYRLKKQLRDNPDTALINLDQLNILIDQFRFMQHRPAITTNHFPRIGIKFAPKNNLQNMQIWEFAVAERAYIEYSQTRENSHLNRLMAILYRKPSAVRIIRKLITGHVDDIRRNFIDDERFLTKQAKKLQATDERIKAFTYIWFESCRAQLPVKYPYVFKKPKADDDNEGSWADVIFALSGETPGNEEKVARVNLHNFLFKLNLTIKAQEELK